jgi:hypothetical protein
MVERAQNARSAHSLPARSRWRRARTRRGPRLPQKPSPEAPTRTNAARARDSCPAGLRDAPGARSRQSSSLTRRGRRGRGNGPRRAAELCVEPLSCCEPTHSEPPDRNNKGDDIRRGVEVVQAEEETYDGSTRQRCERNDHVAKSGCSEVEVPVNRSGRRPPRPPDEREERDTEDGAVDRRG